jgi:hypothetical protein
VHADRCDPSDVDAVVDDHGRAALPRAEFRGFDRFEQLAVGQIFFADLEEPDSGTE